MPEIRHLNNREAYTLRLLNRTFHQAALEAKQAQASLDAYTEELERRYRVRGQQASIDLDLGVLVIGDTPAPEIISQEIKPAPGESPGEPEPENQEKGGDPSA